MWRMVLARSLDWSIPVNFFSILGFWVHLVVFVIVSTFTIIEEMLCCDWKEHRQKSLQIELATKYDTKDA